MGFVFYTVGVESEFPGHGHPLSISNRDSTIHLLKQGTVEIDKLKKSHGVLTRNRGTH